MKITIVIHIGESNRIRTVLYAVPEYEHTLLKMMVF